MDTRFHEKTFEPWAALKPRIHHHKRPPTFNEREIWWASVGMNIGYEVDGKNKFFDRPLLVLRKITRYSFIGIPLSTKIKEENPYYFGFEFKGRHQSALIAQIRLFDARRLNNLMGQLNDIEYEKIREEVKNLL